MCTMVTMSPTELSVRHRQFHSLTLWKSCIRGIIATFFVLCWLENGENRDER